MFYFIKHALWVCMGVVCLYTNINIEATPIYSIIERQLVDETNDIIITVIGFEILIESTEGGNIIVAADLYDSTQQVVRSERAVPPTESLTIDTSGLSSGYYVLQVTTTQGVESFQLHL